MLIIGDLIKLDLGRARIAASASASTPIEMLDTFVNPYHFVIIGAGVAVAVGLWFFLHRTRFGKIVRAAVYSRNMVSALGIPIPMIYAGVFALGVGLAAFAGGVFLPLLPMSLGVDHDIIVQCFAVVVIGGFGSMLGTFVASIIVGVVYSFSILFWPDGALAMIFLIVIAGADLAAVGPVRHRAALLEPDGRERRRYNTRLVARRLTPGTGCLARAALAAARSVSARAAAARASSGPSSRPRS